MPFTVSQMANILIKSHRITNLANMRESGQVHKGWTCLMAGAQNYSETNLIPFLEQITTDYLC